VRGLHPAFSHRSNFPFHSKRKGKRLSEKIQFSENETTVFIRTTQLAVVQIVASKKLQGKEDSPQKADEITCRFQQEHAHVLHALFLSRLRVLLGNHSRAAFS